MHDDVTHLTQLGSNETRYQFDEPRAEMLEVFPSCTADDYEVIYSTSEFSSLCPKTAQPDFAQIEITYVPDKLCVETKSLKLYLFAFRNYGSFMETITNKILYDFVKVAAPRSCVVRGCFAARGGIAIEVVASHKKPQGA